MKKPSKAVGTKSVTSGPPEPERGYSSQDHADRALCRAWSGTSWLAGHSQATCRAAILALTGAEPRFAETREGGMTVRA
jgi:hypothetical protein